MANKSKPSKKPAIIAKKSAVSTPVRNTAIPKTKAAAVSRKVVEITNDMISARAYEIHVSGRGGSETDNWFAAERELRSSV